MQTSNLVYSHPGQPQMQVEVILASTSDHEKPIYTIRMRYPRPIHGEIMTHRVFGRNARSSRAVPVKTMLNEVRNTPYVPWHWGKNQRGMQAEEECNELVNPNPGIANAAYDMYALPYDLTREQAWINASKHAVAAAEAFMGAGYHKQNPNRLLEPFSWIDTLITATQWENFLWLRQHGAAEPHLQDLANLVAQAIGEATLKPLKFGEWHRPYVTDMDIHNLIIRPDEDTERVIDELGCDGDELLNMISAARCARISYKPFDGNSTYRAEFDRYNMLVTSDRVHASPLEHQAKPDNYCGEDKQWAFPELHGNLTGWLQYRKMIPNEVYPSN